MMPPPTQRLSGTNLKASTIFLSCYHVQFLLELTEGARTTQASGSHFHAAQAEARCLGDHMDEPCGRGHVTWPSSHMEHTPHEGAQPPQLCVCVRARVRACM